MQAVNEFPPPWSVQPGNKIASERFFCLSKATEGLKPVWLLNGKSTLS